MGLMIHSLGEIPANAERGYYIYLLDYGWNEPIRNALFDNFENMADRASKTNAVVFKGTVGHHFSDEVLSWHSVNGLDAKNILPALLITTRNPNQFREEGRRDNSDARHKLLLIPMKEVCKSATDVIELIEKVFNDIEHKKSLSDFAVAKEIRSNGQSLVDALILQPNVYGVGVDLKKIIDFFKR